MIRLNNFFILASSIAIFLIALYIFSESKENLQMKKSEFIGFESAASKFHNYYENYSNQSAIEERLKKIITQLNIQKFDMTTDGKTILLYVESISTTTLNELLNAILNQKLNIVKLDIKKDKVIVEVGLI